MNPFDINQAGGSMGKSAKKKKAAPRGAGRKVWVTVSGKRMQTTVRGARILRNARAAFKGLSPD